MDSQYRLPDDFLLGASPLVNKHTIDFSETPLPEYKGLYACILDNVLTYDECNALLRAAEARVNGVWEQAMVNVGEGRQMLHTDTRSCGRIIWDDRDLVARIWARCQNEVPEISEFRDQPKITGFGPVKKGWSYNMTRLNERMRYLCYTEGDYFRPHCDGSFATEDNKEVSFVTLHLYLNESNQESQLEGGATRFHALDWSERYFDVEPKIGRVLLFQHKQLLHSGADVTGGVKFTMRTDVMYEKFEN